MQLTLLAVLVAAYLYVIWRTPADPPPPRRGLAVAAMAAVVAVLVLLRFPGQWAPLLLFVSLSLAVVLPRGPAVRAIALTAVATTALSLWQGVASSTALHGTQALIAGLGILGFLNILGLNLQLVAAQDELARMAVAQERMRFARDLHDLLGHSLSVIALKSELAGGLLPADPARAAGELRDIEQVARRALAEVREAVGGYRQVTLAGELGGARAALEAAGVRAAVEDPPADLPAPVEEVLGWAVREATTNLLRHSGATRCRVHFEEDGGFRLRVELPLRGSPPHDFRVLLAEDQGMVRGALAALLSLQHDIEVVAEVERGDQVVAAGGEHRPDVALLDIEMPGMDGLAAVAALGQAVPGCRALILTAFGRPGYLRRAMDLGAYGFLVKDQPGRRAGRHHPPGRRRPAHRRPGLAATALAEGTSPLSEREREVLAAARDGGTAAEIAARLYLSEGTVRNHLSAAIRKMGRAAG